MFSLGNFQWVKHGSWDGFYISLYGRFGFVPMSHLYPDLCKDLYTRHINATHLEVFFSMHFEAESSLELKFEPFWNIMLFCGVG